MRAYFEARPELIMGLAAAFALATGGMESTGATDSKANGLNREIAKPTSRSWNTSGSRTSKNQMLATWTQQFIRQHSEAFGASHIFASTSRLRYPLCILGVYAALWRGTMQ